MSNIETENRTRRSASGARRRTAVLAVVVVVSLLVGFAVQAPASSGPNEGGHQATPVPYDDYLVFVADGSWNVFEPHPTVPGCAEMFCDGMHFQTEVMGRSPAQIEAKELEAVEHFDSRFGIDVNDEDNDGRILFRTWMADPRFNYRVYSFGGQRVPAEGYEIRDGGWGVFITDPDGYTLGGEFEGVHIPAGAFAFYGDYNILITKGGKAPPEELVLSYRGDTFMTPNEFGDMAFSCALSSDEFASGETTGFAQGFAHLDVDEDGWLNLNIRNVVTFGRAALRR